MQVWISIHTDNHASTPPLSFYRPDALSAAQPTLSKHWRQSRQLRQTKQKQNKCPLNSIFSRTTWVCQYQKGKTIVDFNEANWYGFEMAEARVGPHKNNLHLTPWVKAPSMPTPHHSIYRLDTLSDVQPTMSKHWRQLIKTTANVKQHNLEDSCRYLNEEPRLTIRLFDRHLRELCCAVWQRKNAWYSMQRFQKFFDQLRDKK